MAQRNDTHSASRSTIALWVVRFELLRQINLPSVLSADELARAGAIKAPPVACDYRLGRALLRLLLAAQLQRAPSEIEFDYGAAGKPVLPGGPAFNLSHCPSMLAIAIADNDFRGRIGVDVERHVEDWTVDKLPRRGCSAKEHEQLIACPAGRVRRVAFTRFWTRKEAIIKAHGGGIQLALQQFDVSLKQADGRRSLLMASRLDWLSPTTCELRDPGSRGNCELALAVLHAASGDSCRLIVHEPDVVQLALLAAGAAQPEPKAGAAV